jgi:signal transduction histidine kinase
VLPFAVAALAAMAVSALLTRQAIEAALRERVESQIVNAASLLAQSGFALTPTVIGSVRAIADADVLTLDRQGAVLATTMEAARAAEVSSALIAAAAGRQEAGRPVIHAVPCGQATCYAAVDVVHARPDLLVAVVDRGTELAAANRGTVSTVVTGGVTGLVLLLVVSQFVGRRVTLPIERLVAFTQSAGNDASAGRAAEGGDEVGRLGRAFNGMLNRLADSRRAIVRHEKLALAGLFAARVAHDIRNPLSSIKMQTQLLQNRLRGAGDEKTLASLAAVASDIRQVESVVRDLLEVARPGEVRRVAGDLNALVARCLAQVADRLAYRNIRQEVILDGDLPLVPIDEDRLHQAILNVITNAADAVTSGCVVAVRTVARPGVAVLTIVDDGEGVPADVLAHVFDPFFTTKPDGVGLGLVNAKSVVEQHGGTIALEPALPGGTRVTITLPLADGEKHDG